jgi:hypothetical protein
MRLGGTFGDDLAEAISGVEFVQLAADQAVLFVEDREDPVAVRISE